MEVLSLLHDPEQLHRQHWVVSRPCQQAPVEPRPGGCTPSHELLMERWGSLV